MYSLSEHKKNDLLFTSANSCKAKTGSKVSFFHRSFVISKQLWRRKLVNEMPQQYHRALTAAPFCGLLNDERDLNPGPRGEVQT